METTTKTLATAKQIKDFNKGLILVNEVLIKLYELDESTAIWLPATVEAKKQSEGGYIKPSIPAHGFFYKTASDKMFGYVNDIYSSRDEGLERVNIYVKVVKQFPRKLDLAEVEHHYSKNPAAIENWKNAIAKPGSANLVVMVVEEIEE